MIKIKTEILKRSLSKAIKACSMERTIPLSSLLQIEIASKELTITTTDGENVLQIFAKLETEETPFSVVVEAKKLYDLVMKTTTKYIELSVQDKNLQILGNGTYLFEIAMDDSNNPVIIHFPSVDQSVSEEIAVDLDLKELTKLLNVNEKALPITVDDNAILGYYMSDDIITTDGMVVCASTNVEKLVGKKFYLAKNYVSLLLGMDMQDITICKENGIYILGKDFKIYGKEEQGMESFPIEAITGYLKEENTYSVSLNQQSLMDTLDRLSLFVTQYDRDCVKINFAKDFVSIESMAGNGKEKLNYVKEEEIKTTDSFEIIMSLDMLKKQIGVLDDLNVGIDFGTDVSISVTTPHIKQILCTMEAVD